MGDGTDDPEEGFIEGESVEIDMPEAVRSQEMVIREERASTPAPASVLPSPKEWEASMAVAREIAGTQFVPESYRGRPDAVVAAILTGREMGIGPMQALRQIHMIDGRPTFAADLMLAKMRQGGIQILASKVTDDGAWITAKRKDTGEETQVSFTTEDADKAGLLGKKNWRTYRQDMFWARAVGRLARRLGSDLLGGLVYSKEELEDSDDGGYDASVTRKEFDAETDLAEGAVSGEGAPRTIAGALRELEPVVDWKQLMSDVTVGVYGAVEWRELDAENMRDFWRRLSNATFWMQDVSPPGSFPPISSDQIKEQIARAFSGLVIEVPYVEVAEPDEAAPLTAEQAKAADEAIEKEDIEFPEAT